MLGGLAQPVEITTTQVFVQSCIEITCMLLYIDL